MAAKHIASFRAALDVVARERRYLLFLEAPPLKAVRAYCRHAMKEGHPRYVALAGERVVGWCDVHPGDRVTTAHSGVLGIGVVPEFRGRGIGRALLGTVLEKARSSGLTRVELTVRQDNRRAIALYEKLAFVREGVKRNAMRVDGKYWNLVCMALLVK
jgi:ribosomal protein S18 acetylase RimI-like enzyme